MLKSINTLQIERTMIRMEMKTEILPASDEKSIEKAAALLQNGELVALPTETVYGIAADARNGEAVKKIFVAKGRPQDNPLIVHVTGPEMLPGLVSEVPERAQLLMAAFCPGTSLTRPGSMSGPAMWTMRGLSCGRPFATKIFLTASPLRASAAIPYTVSVGRATSSPCRRSSAPRAMPAASAGRSSVFIFIQIIALFYCKV